MASEVHFRVDRRRAGRNPRDKFFEEFERADLAFVYRDTGPNGELDDFHEFVNRAAVPELTASGRLTIVEQAT